MRGQRSGELRRRVVEQGLTGVTVNPSIFRSALRGSDAYDPDIRELAGRPPQEIYEALIVADVRVRALSLGADDYLTKPFSPKIRIARIKALLRRAGLEAEGTLTLGGLTLRPLTSRATSRPAPLQRE